MSANSSHYNAQAGKNVPVSKSCGDCTDDAVTRQATNVAQSVGTSAVDTPTILVLSSAMQLVAEVRNHQYIQVGKICRPVLSVKCVLS